MDLVLADDMWELHQKFESVAKPWALDVNKRLRKFGQSAKLVLQGSEDNPYTYTVKFVIANYNYKDTESPDFWDPFVKVYGNSDYPAKHHGTAMTGLKSIWVKVERDCLQSHDQDPKLPGFPVTTFYNYVDENSEVTENELCSLSKKFGDEWKELAEHILDELTPNFIDKYVGKDVDFDYYPAVTVNSITRKNAPLISPGAKPLQGQIEKVKVVVQSDRICKARFVIRANGWKKPTPNIDAEGIRNVWG